MEREKKSRNFTLIQAVYKWMKIRFRKFVLFGLLAIVSHWFKAFKKSLMQVCGWQPEWKWSERWKKKEGKKLLGKDMLNHFATSTYWVSSPYVVYAYVIIITFAVIFFSPSRSLNFNIWINIFQTFYLVGGFGINDSSWKKNALNEFGKAVFLCFAILCCWEITTMCHGLVWSLWYMETKWTQRMCNERVDCQTYIYMHVSLCVCVCVWEHWASADATPKQSCILLY